MHAPYLGGCHRQGKLRVRLEYKRGATVLTGDAEFQFKAGDLNGASDYGFMLAGVDDKLTPGIDVGLFRISIWRKDSGDAGEYKNEMVADDDAGPTMVIGGGSILIHKK